MASRYESSGSSPVILSNPTNPTTSSSSSSGSSQGTSTSHSFTGIEDPEALKILMEQIKQLASGGTADYKAQRAERSSAISDVKNLSKDYSKDKAFQDAADLVAQSVRVSMEKNMPAISKSIQGAGTSASSMQGLLSQKLATDSAQAAGALGAQQAVSYGGISANLAGVLESLTRLDTSNDTGLTNALNLLRNTTSNSSSQQSSTQSSTQSSSGGGGGGSYVAQGGSAPTSNSSNNANSRSGFNDPYFAPQVAQSDIYYSAPASFASYAGGNSYTSNDIPSGGGFIAVGDNVTSTFNNGVNTPVSNSDYYYSGSSIDDYYDNWY